MRGSGTQALLEMGRNRGAACKLAENRCGVEFKVSSQIAELLWLREFREFRLKLRFILYYFVSPISCLLPYDIGLDVLAHFRKAA